MVRTGAERAIVRAEIDDADSPTLVEAEIVPAGRSRTRVNRKSVSGRKELAPPRRARSSRPRTSSSSAAARRVGATCSTTPWLCSTPRGRGAADETDRVLRQRAALLRQSGGRASEEVVATLDVWDQRLADAGKVLVAARERLAADLDPLVASAYSRLAGEGGRDLVQQRLRRGAGTGTCSTRSPPAARTTCGGASTPWARTATTCSSRSRAARPGPTPPRASSAAWRWPCAWASTSWSGRRTPLVPTLLLDDVFSELDPARSRALVAELPAGQSILTTAAPLPEGIEVARVLPVGTLVDR